MKPDFHETRCNEEAARLLPWYVNGRLSAADMDRVASHLQRCAICRDDLAREAAVHSLIKTDERVEYAPQAGLAKTLSRIDELARDAPVHDHDRTDPGPAAWAPASRAERRTGAVQWLTAAVVLQAVALGWLGVSLRHASEGAAVPNYHTLSTDSRPVSAAHLRVVFDPVMSLAQLGALLTEDHLAIVSGPSSAGAYTLASTEPVTDAAQLDSVVARLRGDRRVLFAESAINDGSSRP